VCSHVSRKSHPCIERRQNRLSIPTEPRTVPLPPCFLYALRMLTLRSCVVEGVGSTRTPGTLFVWASFNEDLSAAAYLRPLRITHIKALFDAAQGSHYWLIFRGFQALLISLAILLFARALRVATRADFAASAFAQRGAYVIRPASGV
jgi:hypothetical protein